MFYVYKYVLTPTRSCATSAGILKIDFSDDIIELPTEILVSRDGVRQLR